MHQDNTSSPHETDEDNEPIELPEAVIRLARRGITISKPTIYRWASEGLIPTTRLGRYRTTVAAVLKALRPSEVA